MRIKTVSRAQKPLSQPQPTPAGGRVWQCLCGATSVPGVEIPHFAISRGPSRWVEYLLWRSRVRELLAQSWPDNAHAVADNDCRPRTAARSSEHFSGQPTRLWRSRIGLRPRQRVHRVRTDAGQNGAFVCTQSVPLRLTWLPVNFLTWHLNAAKSRRTRRGRPQARALLSPQASPNCTFARAEPVPACLTSLPVDVSTWHLNAAKTRRTVLAHKARQTASACIVESASIAKLHFRTC